MGQDIVAHSTRYRKVIRKRVKPEDARSIASEGESDI